MRLTCILYRQNYYRTIQRVWKREGKMPINELAVPPELQEVAVKVYDAKELFMNTKKEAKELFMNTKKDEPQVAKPGIPTIDYYHMGEKFYLFHQKTRLTEGLEQVLALTKTVSYEGLPPKLSNLVGVEQIPNQDNLVKDCIKQSLLWDAWQIRLPRKIDIQRPGWIFPREYGVPLKRKTSSLLNKLVLLCESASGTYPGSLRRGKVTDANSDLHISSGGESITFQLCSDIVITDEKPLKPFASPLEVEDTKVKELPALYPIKPTLDLDQCETCPTTDICEKEELPHAATKGYIHTLHVPHKSIGFFFPVQKQARGIACCFSFAAEEARRLYGPDIKELPEPVSVQCIYMDVKTFGFLAYQLNTLCLDDGNGIKNQVWVDGPHDLYEEISEENVTNYNSDVFTKMLAFYMNGVHPTSLEV